MTKKEIGQVVSKTRAKKKMSLYALNKTAGVQRNQVLAIETGDKSYTIDSLLDTCKALGITIHTSHNG